MAKYQITVKKFVCKSCKHEIVYHTDLAVSKPDACFKCKGKEITEKRSEV